MRSINAVKSIGALALILALATNLALAGNPNPGVLPPNAKPHGMTYGQWGDAWWQWAFALPRDNNPVVDPTGDLVAVGQSGPVWFLGGVFWLLTDPPGLSVVERTVTIPTGKALFFPIGNSLWINLPELGDQPWSPEQEEYARGVVAGTMNNATDLTCEIDGRAVQNLEAYRCQTPPGGAFMIDIPVNDVWGLGGFGLPEPDTYGPSVQDGIYLMLAPLSAGQHAIHFTASFASAIEGERYTLDVTYHLTVHK